MFSTLLNVMIFVIYRSYNNSVRIEYESGWKPLWIFEHICGGGPVERASSSGAQRPSTEERNSGT